MKKSITIDKKLINAIVNSLKITEKQKMYWLKYVWYLTLSERKELLSLI